MCMYWVCWGFSLPPNGPGLVMFWYECAVSSLHPLNPLYVYVLIWISMLSSDPLLSPCVYVLIWMSAEGSPCSPITPHNVHEWVMLRVLLNDLWPSHKDVCRRFFLVVLSDCQSWWCTNIIGMNECVEDCSPLAICNSTVCQCTRGYVGDGTHCYSKF